MKKQTIIWTSLPNGFATGPDGQQLMRISVFVSPRLETDEGLPEPQLSQFPDFAGNWVNKVAALSFSVELQDGTSMEANMDTGPLDAELWDELFNEETYVRPHQFRDLSNRTLRSYPIKGVMSYLKDTYVKIGEHSPGKLPLLEPERDDDGNPVGNAGATLDGFITDMGEVLKPEKDILCEMTGEEYHYFRNAMKGEEQFGTVQDEGKYYVLAYISACLKKKKITLSEKVRVELVNDLVWKILDEDVTYFVEDTGHSIIVFRYGDLYEGIDNALKIEKVLDPAKSYGYAKEKLDFIQANRFYDRVESAGEYHLKPNALHVPDAPNVEKVDFHQMLATLGDHPLMMRKLGIVIDLTIPMVADQQVSSVKVVPGWTNDNPPSAFHTDSSPSTFCILNNDFFIARPKPGSPLVNGMLDLSGADEELNGSPSEYHLLQVDPEGSALKNLRAASSMTRQFKKKYRATIGGSMSKKALENGCDLQLDTLKNVFKEVPGLKEELSYDAKLSAIAGDKWVISDKGKQFEVTKTAKDTLHVYDKRTTSFDTPEDSGLPSLRTSGLAVFKDGRAFELYDRLKQNLGKDNSLNANAAVELYADDLIRGYRVDVLDQSLAGDPEWQSLCRRIGSYFVGSDALNPSAAVNPIQVDDEGYVKGASTSSKDKENSDLYLNETIFRWDGWSMVAKRPGKTIVPVPGVREEYLFNWKDVPADPTEFLAFLKSMFHARWTQHATIQKPVADQIEVFDSKRKFTLVESNGSVTLTTHQGKEFKYTLRDEGGDWNVYNSIPTQDESMASPVNSAATEFKFGNDLRAKPGSLPKLRFGHRYKLRARTVDLAGNSISWQTFDASGASKAIKFCRFEPLIPATLVPRSIFTEGEAVEHMVIRSNYDMTTQEYIQHQDVVDALQNEDFSYETGNERHVIPPKTSQIMAETHGAFDDYFGQGKNYEEGYRIALKEEGTIADTAIVNTNTGIKESIPDPNSVQVIVPAHDPSVPAENVPGQYIIHTESQFLLPYLPDPVGRGVVFRGLPGITASGTAGLEKVIDPALELNLIKVPFDLAWPEALPFRIRIEERSGEMIGDQCVETFANTEDPPVWDAGNRVLTVFLGKADVRKVKYSCYFNEEDLDNMGIWKWLRNSIDLSNLKRYALAGSHWMMTPFRELTLVHAVQQPLCQPSLPVLNGIKHKIGDTRAEIRGDFHLSARSSGKVNLKAHWTEPVDDILLAGPTTKNVHSNAFEVKVTDTTYNTMKIPVAACSPYHHEFGDTKYRRVQYYLTAATRFREYFHPDLSDTAGGSPKAAIEYCFEWGNLPGSDSPVLLSFLERVSLIGDTDSATVVKSDDGQILTITESPSSLSVRLNSDRNGLLVQTSAGKQYVYVVTTKNDGKLCITTDKISRQGQITEIDVLNSARPLAPQVQYVLPTFGWEQTTDNGKETGWKSIQRTRVGGGLRVYLDRPWYSSGDGELLGVTLYSQLVPDKLKPYVTQWGMDPIRKSKIPKGGLGIADFENVEQGQSNLSLAELNDPKVNVAGFKVEYNEERRLWYSDIQIKAEIMNSYFPFIRLALARYQPKSIVNAHLSRVVLTDFIQVANDRTLNIDFTDKMNSFTISVTGKATGDRASNRVEAAIEFLSPGSHEEFGWEPVSSIKAQPNPYTLKLKPVDASAHLWKWEANLKMPRPKSEFKYRIVVREYERFSADTNLDNAIMLATAMGAHHFVKDAERLVYADLVYL